MTQNLDERIRRHNNCFERTTKSYRPFVLIHSEKFNSRLEARAREKYLKSGAGKEFFKNLE